MQPSLLDATKPLIWRPMPGDTSEAQWQSGFWEGSGNCLQRDSEEDWRAWVSYPSWHLSAAMAAINCAGYGSEGYWAVLVLHLQFWKNGAKNCGYYKDSIGPSLVFTYNKQWKSTDRGNRGRGGRAFHSLHCKRIQLFSLQVEEWVRKLQMGEERRALVTDGFVSRGWEAKAIVAISSTSEENLIMRAIGFCFLIRIVVWSLWGTGWIHLQKY